MKIKSAIFPFNNNSNRDITMGNRKRKISKGERAVRRTLTQLNISYVPEKTFVNCKSPKDRLLRFDFYLPFYNLLIEYQGQHHYNPINKYKRAKIVHEKTLIHDNIKRQFAKDNGITLLAIHYKDLENVPYIITNVISEKGGEHGQTEIYSAG
jgi:hypothetical protein